MNDAFEGADAAVDWIENEGILVVAVIVDAPKLGGVVRDPNVGAAFIFGKVTVVESTEPPNGYAGAGLLVAKFVDEPKENALGLAEIAVGAEVASGFVPPKLKVGGDDVEVTVTVEIDCNPNVGAMLTASFCNVFVSIAVVGLKLKDGGALVFAAADVESKNKKKDK